MLDINLSLIISPHGKNQGIEVQQAWRPNILGPLVEACLEPVLDDVFYVAGGPIVHQNDIIGIVKVGPGSTATHGCSI